MYEMFLEKFRVPGDMYEVFLRKIVFWEGDL